MADDKTDPNAESSDDKKKKTDDKVTFTEDQQALLQKIVDGAYTKAYEKAEGQWKGKLDTLTAQVEELKKTPAKKDEQKPPTVPDDKPKDEKKDKPHEAAPEYTALAAQLDEIRTVATGLKADKDKADAEIAAERKKNKEARIKEQYFRSSDKVDFFDRMDVFALIEGELDLDDDGNVVIMNPKTKQPRISGVDPEKNMSLDQYLTDFAKAKPHMVRATNADGGSGSGENRRTETTTKKDVVDYNKMTDEEFRALTSKVISQQYIRRT